MLGHNFSFDWPHTYHNGYIAARGDVPLQHHRGVESRAETPQSMLDEFHSRRRRFQRQAAVLTGLIEPARVPDFEIYRETDFVTAVLDELPLVRCTKELAEKLGSNLCKRQSHPRIKPINRPPRGK